jgi:peptide/nickel transport system permease protein
MRSWLKVHWPGVAAAALVALALCGFFLTPHDPAAQLFIAGRLAGPGAGHWLGVDGLGRDFFSRMWLGTANTIVPGSTASALTLLLASGLLAAERAGPRWFGGFVRNLVSVGIAMPVLFVGLLLLVFLKPSAPALVAAVSIGGVPFAFRQLRVIWAEQANALHVLASRALGATTDHLVKFTIWPNVRGQVWSLAKILFAVSVLELSGLTFLGLTGDPDFAELGTLLRQNQAHLFQQSFLVVWPGVVLTGLLLLVQLSAIRGRGSPAG